MRIIPIDSVKSFLSDRTILALVGLILITGVFYSIYVGFVIEPSDLQVATRYTAFSDTHFYRDKWYHLLSFISFAFMVITIHIAIAVKFYSRSQRNLAVALLVLTLLLLTIVWITTRSVLQIAFL